MHKSLISMILALLTFQTVSAQSNTAIGEWKSYFPYSNAEDVTQSDDYIYFMSQEAIARLAKEDGSIDFLTTVDGLNETLLQTIRFSPFDQLLIIAYANSSIDLVFEDEIVNLNSIVTNNNITGSRLINDIYIADRTKAYFSTDFGIVELNLERREFGFTAFTPISVYSVVIRDDYYYAATEEGIYRAPISPSFNPADFALWELMGSEYGLPAVYESLDLEVYEERMYAVVDGSVYREESPLSFQLFDQQSGYEASFMSSDGRDLLIGYDCGNCNGRIVKLSPDGSLSQINNGCVSRPHYAIQDESGNIWHADDFRGFRSTKADGGCDNFRLNSPFTNRTYDVYVQDDQVYLATGGVTSSFNFLFNRAGFSILDTDGLWTNVNDLDNPSFAMTDLIDILYVLPHPNNPDLVYAGSYGGGLAEYRGGEDFMIYDQSNSTLDGTPGTANSERVSGMSFDLEGNLWLSNYLAARPLSVFKSDGSWQSFTLPSTLVAQLDTDLRGYKWILERGQGGGFIVFDEGDMDDPNDDRVKRYTSSNSELQTNNVTYIAIDRDGDAWVGTDQGPVIFECGDPFSSDCRGSRRKVDQDGFIAFLLETEKINSIAVDGANRKWFGTDNGVFVQSPSGETQIHHFTTQNSPLPSDQISDLAINDNNGEVFIATTAGLISYRSDAIAGRAFHDKSAKVFPNPVQPDYEGPVAIAGLAEDALVKITDISGKIVTELRANGGQAVWDGRDLSGTEVASGVYLVMSSTTDILADPDGLIAKILYLR